MSKKPNLWRLWAKSLGEKVGKNDREADYIAGIRSFILFTYLLTNIFIVAGVIRHWNDDKPTIYYVLPESCVGSNNPMV
jgi:hypothetical protein